MLFYKPQGILLDGNFYLKSEDFVLIIMTSAQCEYLKRFGTDCICCDGTHGMNGYGFELNTLLVLDDLREGVPCALMISNRSDTQVLKLFISQIKERSGIIKENVFMSDLAEAFYNAWIEEMCVPDKR